MNANDFIVGLDPTGFVNITGAQLAQLVNSASPQTDRGFILVSQDSLGVPNVPNAAVTTQWQRYIWLRILATSVIPYVWNPAAAPDPKYLNWVTIQQSSFVPNTIPGTALIANSVPASALQSIAYSQITGVPTLAATNGNNYLAQDGLLSSALFSNASFVWGCLQGNANPGPGGTSAPVLAAGAVTSASIPAQAVKGSLTSLAAQIADGTVSWRQLIANTGPSTSSQGLIASGGGVDPQINIIVPAKSLNGLPTSSNYNISATGVSALPGDILAISCDNSGSITGAAGWVPVRRAILTLPEPTSQTYTQLPVVAANGTAYSLQNMSVFQSIFQHHVYSSLTNASGTNYIANLTTAPTTSNTNLLAIWSTTPGNIGGTSNSVSITPTSTTTTITVEAIIQVSGTGYAVAVLLYNNNTTTFVAACITYINNNNSDIASLKYCYVPASTNAQSFSVYYASLSNATSYVNSTITNHGGITALLCSSIELTEALV